MLTYISNTLANSNCNQLVKITYIDVGKSKVFLTEDIH